jgi:hypothetical protein
VDGASAFSYPLIFLPFISSAFVPTDTMPGPVRAFAEHQPVTSIVNTIRDLFTQQPVGTDIWIALAWCVGILVVAYVFAMASPTAARSPPRTRRTTTPWSATPTPPFPKPSAVNLYNGTLQPITGVRRRQRHPGQRHRHVLPGPGHRPDPHHRLRRAR